MKRAPLLALLMTIFVCACGKDPAFETNVLPPGAVGVHYGYKLEISDWSAGYFLRWDPDSLPPGLTLDQRSRIISGYPQSAGRYYTEICIWTIPNNNIDCEQFTIIINETKRP